MSRVLSIFDHHRNFTRDHCCRRKSVYGVPPRESTLTQWSERSWGLIDCCLPRKRQARLPHHPPDIHTVTPPTHTLTTLHNRQALTQSPTNKSRRRLQLFSFLLNSIWFFNTSWYISFSGQPRLVGWVGGEEPSTFLSYLSTLYS